VRSGQYEPGLLTHLALQAVVATAVVAARALPNPWHGLTSLARRGEAVASTGVVSTRTLRPRSLRQSWLGIAHRRAVRTTRDIARGTLPLLRLWKRLNRLLCGGSRSERCNRPKNQQPLSEGFHPNRQPTTPTRSNERTATLNRHTLTILLTHTPGANPANRARPPIHFHACDLGSQAKSKLYRKTKTQSNLEQPCGLVATWEIRVYSPLCGSLDKRSRNFSAGTGQDPILPPRPQQGSNDRPAHPRPLQRP
jgi:hypothetical protein